MESLIQTVNTLLAQLKDKSASGSADVFLMEKQLNEAELQLEKYEPILRENPQRFVIFPIKYDTMWNKFYKIAVANFWTAEEISFDDDIKQWNSNKLSDDDRFFIKHVLAMFAGTDGIVNENLAQRFYSEVQVPEARSFYGFQIAIENIHGETYSLLIDTFVNDQKEKEQLFNAIRVYPSIGKLSNWAIKWIHSNRPFNQRLVAFACVEGILFSGPFCAIFWLKKRGLMPGLTFSNELISRDEGLHMDFACHLNSVLDNPADPDTILQIVQEAVAFEKEFINESLPCRLIGMNAEEMSRYIEYVADRLLTQLGCKKHWNTPNPFSWMDLISTENKTNFFERRVGEYGKASITVSGAGSASASVDSKPSGIEILDDF